MEFIDQTINVQHLKRDQQKNLIIQIRLIIWNGKFKEDL